MHKHSARIGLNVVLLAEWEERRFVPFFLNFQCRADAFPRQRLTVQLIFLQRLHIGKKVLDKFHRDQIVRMGLEISHLAQDLGHHLSLLEIDDGFICFFSPLINKSGFGQKLRLAQRRSCTIWYVHEVFEKYAWSSVHKVSMQRTSQSNLLRTNIGNTGRFNNR